METLAASPAGEAAGIHPVFWGSASVDALADDGEPFLLLGCWKAAGINTQVWKQMINQQLDEPQPRNPAGWIYTRKAIFLRYSTTQRMAKDFPTGAAL